MLRTRPLGKTRSKVGFIEKLLAKLIIKPVSRTAYATYCAKRESYLSGLDFLAKLESWCAVIYPTSEGNVAQTCTDHKKRMRAAKDGYQAALESMSVPD